jgi:hypothetical protein
MLDIRSESACIYIRELKRLGEIARVSKNLTRRMCARGWLTSGISRLGSPFDSEKYGWHKCSVAPHRSALDYVNAPAPLVDSQSTDR